MVQNPPDVNSIKEKENGNIFRYVTLGPQKILAVFPLIIEMRA